MFDPRDWRKRDLIDAMRNVAPTCLPGNPTRQSALDIRKAAFRALALKGEQFVNECIRLSQDGSKMTTLTRRAKGQAMSDAVNRTWYLLRDGLRTKIAMFRSRSAAESYREFHARGLALNPEMYTIVCLDIPDEAIS